MAINAQHKISKMSKLPDWFNGEIYEMGDEVRNPFSGETALLTAEELSMYDLIMGAQLLIEENGGIFKKEAFKYQKDLRKGLDWFRKVNPKAYMVLLD